MREIISILACVLFSFLYIIFYTLITKYKKITAVKKYYTYIWAALVLFIALIYQDSLIRKISFNFFNDHEFINDILHIVVYACILGCFSGYKSINKKYDFQFCIIFPIFEEILFRGVILILLINVGHISNGYAVILSALLFGIMHFQYFGFKKETIRFVLFAFLGGYFFANIALTANSIIPTIFLHMVFNGSAILFSKYKSKNS